MRLSFEFPDGQLARMVDFPDNASLDRSVDVRVQDVSFLLDQLSRASVIRQLIPGANAGLDVSRVAMFGQSIVGATTIRTMMNAKRIACGANLDGRLLGSDGNKTVDRPFLLWGATGHNSTSDDSWAGILTNAKAWKQELSLVTSEHMTFSDEPRLAKLFGAAGRPDVQDGIGNLDGDRVAAQILPTYLAAFFNLALHRTDSEILYQPDPSFPEVLFV